MLPHYVEEQIAVRAMRRRWVESGPGMRRVSREALGRALASAIEAMRRTR